MRGRFWTNVAGVLSGSAIAQAIPVLGALVLARLFLPEAYGTYAVWLGFVMVLAVILTLRLEMALVVVGDGEHREEAMAFVLVTIAIIAAAAALGAAIISGAGLWSGPLGTPALLFSVVAAAVLTAASESWQGLAAADGTYRILVKIRIGRAACILLCQIAAALLSRKPEALILGHLGGLGLTLIFIPFVRPLRFPAKAGLLRRTVAFWRSYSRFPTFALPADLISSVSSQLPLLILSFRFGAEVAGIFALSMRVLLTPVSLLGRSVLDVFRRYAAEAFRQRGECKAEYVSTIRGLFLCSLLLLAGIYLFAEYFFVFAFGETWRQAGMFALWLAPLVALGFMASPMSYVFYIVGRQNIDLMWQTGLFLVVLGALLMPGDVKGAIISYSYGYSLMYLIYIFLSYTASKGLPR